jgi:hypothetical protein
MLAETTQHITETTERVSELGWPGAAVLIAAMFAVLIFVIGVLK